MTSTNEALVVVVGRDVAAADHLRRALTLAHYDVRWCRDASDARVVLATGTVDLVVLDRRAGGELTPQTLRANDVADAEFITLVPDESERFALLAAGSFACVGAPWDIDELLLLAGRAISSRRDRRELVAGNAARAESAAATVTGRSPVMQRTRELIARAALWRGPVVITGEAGTGKQRVARAIHALSSGGRGEVVTFDCSAGDDECAAALFDGWSGAPSLIAQAAGGALLLTRAELLSSRTLVRLQRQLDVRGAGERGMMPPRVLLTMRSGVSDAAALLGRVLTIDVPSLRERRSDIPLLAQEARAAFVRDSGVDAPALTGDQIAHFVASEWPDNVRQLERAVTQLMLTAMRPTKAVAVDSAPVANASAVSVAPPHAADEQWSLAQLERHHIFVVLERVKGNQSRAADILGIDRRTLYRKLREYGRQARDVADARAASDRLERRAS